MKLIPSLCMMIGHLEYYHLLSKIIRLSDTYNASQGKQLFVSWIEYDQEILVLHQIVRDSQWIENQASASLAMTTQAISYNLEPEPMLNFNQIFTPKGNINRCISSICSYYITRNTKYYPSGSC